MMAAGLQSGGRRAEPASIRRPSAPSVGDGGGQSVGTVGAVLSVGGSGPLSVAQCRSALSVGSTLLLAALYEATGDQTQLGRPQQLQTSGSPRCMISGIIRARIYQGTGAVNRFWTAANLCNTFKRLRVSRRYPTCEDHG